MSEQSFYKWDNKSGNLPKNWNSFTNTQRWEHIWEAAQANLLADPYIVDARFLADAKNWPNGCKVMRLDTYDDNDRYLGEVRQIRINRPKTKHKYKPGDVVFAKISETISIGQIAKTDGYSFTIALPDDTWHQIQPDELRPFDQAKITTIKDEWEEGK
jgi:hypothetical protein